MNMPSATDAPRCPLGFTGTPPPGHPSIPGAASSPSTDPSKSLPTFAKAQALLANLAAQPWSATHTMLVLDALFLIGATLVAIYWDRIPALQNLRANPGRTTASGGTSTGAASKAGSS